MSFPSYLPVYPPENEENDNSSKLRKIPEGLIGKVYIYILFKYIVSYVFTNQVE